MSYIINDHTQIESDIEYATQFFGFTAKSFCNGVYNATVQYIGDGIKALTENIVQQHEDTETKAELETAMQDVQRQAVHKADAYFDKLEKFLRDSIFYVPQHVALPEDTTHGSVIEDPEQEEERLDRQIQRLTRQIQVVNRCTVTLQSEKKSCLEYTESCQNLLNSCPSINEDVDLSEELKLVETHLRSLKEQIEHSVY